MSNKFARCNVTPDEAAIWPDVHYVEQYALVAEYILRELKMKKIVTILGAALLTASTVQMASAGQRDNARKMQRSQQIEEQQFRGSNAYDAPADRGFRNDNYGYGGYAYSNDRLDALRAGGAISAPAGR